MKVQLRNDNLGMRLVGSPELTPTEAVSLVNDLLQACAECGEPVAVGANVQREITGQMVTLMVNRAAKVIPQLLEHKISPADAARQIVDIVLNAAQGRVVH